MTDEILSLQEKIKSLQNENQYLKSLLDQAGIFYHVPDKTKSTALFEPDQGARIVPREITDHDANLFFSMFWGRTDVYAKRTVKKSTGEANYYTQCYFHCHCRDRLSKRETAHLWTRSNEAIEINEILEQDGEKPWDRTRDFLRCDVDGELRITLAMALSNFSNSRYVDHGNACFLEKCGRAVCGALKSGL